MYSQLLQHERRRPDFAERDALFEEVWNEASLESVIKDWNARVVCEALKETQELLGRGDRTYMVLGCFAQPVKCSGSSRPLLPDWAAICKTQAWEPGRCDALQSFMPGDTKISTGWKSGEIEEGETKFAKNQRPNWFKPLAQIFTYCFELRVRYGYLITDKELVAVRIGPHPNAPRANGPATLDQQIIRTQNQGLLEFATVTWAQEERSNASLTVNLALWWLHLLAAKDSSIQWEYPPLERETLPGQDQQTDAHVGSRQTGSDTESDATAEVTVRDSDTESDAKSEVTVRGSPDDRVTYSFDQSPGNGIDGSVVPESTSVETRARFNLRKRQRTDEQQGDKKKVRA